MLFRSNTKKLTTDRSENILLNTALRFDVAVPVRTLKVLTTASFAVNPVMSAVETLQSENQRKKKLRQRRGFGF